MAVATTLEEYLESRNIVYDVVEHPHTNTAMRAAEAATEAGADKVGMEDLAEEVKGGNLDFDVVVAAPDAMRVVGQLGQILGPRGLMPNPKVGTVAQDVATAVKNAKAGQVRYRTDKAGIIHCPIGKVEFDSGKLKENLEALLADLNKAKPSSAKGIYMKKVSVSTTMGPGLQVDQARIDVGEEGVVENVKDGISDNEGQEGRLDERTQFFIFGIPLGLPHSVQVDDQ